MAENEKHEDDGSEDKNSPKVLRIGIIQGGKIIEERRLKRRETVSVGQSPKASFVVTSPTMPKSFDLFEFSGNQYFLRFTDEMDGRIQLTGDAVSDFKALKTDATKRGNAYATKLNDKSRGKVMIGDVTVLFQFVTAPALAMKGELPVEAQGSVLAMIDVQYASIFVAVSIVLISIAAYARTQPYVEPSTIEEVSERFQKLIMPDRVPEPPKPEEAAEEAGEKKTEEKKEAKKDDGKPKEKRKLSDEERKAQEEAAANARKEAIRKKVAGAGLLGVIGTTGKGKAAGALNDVFSDGAFGKGDLGDAFSGIQGVDIASSSGQQGTRGGGAGTGASIGSLATAGGGNVETGGKAETAVQGTITNEAPEVEGSLDADVIQREMKKNMRALKDCYDRELKRYPNLAGKLTMSFEIQDKTGRVVNFEFTDDSLGSEGVKSCISSRAKYWRFPAPSDGNVFVSFPLVLAPSS